MSSERAGRDLDTFYSGGPSPRTISADSESACLSPSEVSGIKNYQGQDPLRHRHVFAADSPADSPENSTRSSSSESPPNHFRNPSMTSTGSASNTESTMLPFGYSEEWVNPDFASMREHMLFGLDSTTFPGDADIESSNKVMDAAFDFESAASSPSPLKMDAPTHPKSYRKSKNATVLAKRSAERMVTSPVSRGLSPLFHAILLTLGSFLCLVCQISLIASQPAPRFPCPLPQPKSNRLPASGKDSLPPRSWRKVSVVSI